MVDAVKPRRTRRALDFVSYALIGIAIYGGLLWSLARGTQGELAGKSFGFGLFTLVLFGEALANHKKSFKYRRFWLVIIGLVVSHCTLIAGVLWHIEGWRAIWLVVLYPIESVAIDRTLSAFEAKR